MAPARGLLMRDGTLVAVRLAASRPA